MTSINRDLEEAKKAWDAKDVNASVLAHSTGVSKENHAGEAGEHIQSIVFGGLDGIMTTFAIISAAAAAGLSNGAILIIGFANLVGDAFGMVTSKRLVSNYEKGVGDFISSKAEEDHETAERKREEWEIENCPEIERNEMVDIYMSKGISREDAIRVVDLLFNSSKKAFLDVMMIEELGIMPKEGEEAAWKGALVTFGAFMILGGIPMLPYLFSGRYTEVGRFNAVFGSAIALFGVTLFILGAFKGYLTGKKWYKTGLTMLLNGSVTTAIAYFLGVGFEKILS